MRVGAPKTAYLLLIILLAFYMSAFAGWSAPIRLSNPGGHAYPKIITQGDTLHVVAEDFGPPYKIGYWRSSDRGETWSNIAVLSDSANTYDTRDSRIIVNGPHLLVLWRYGIIHGIGYNLGYNRSDDNGLSWGQAGHILNTNWGSPLESAASGESSIVKIVFARWDGDSLNFCSVRSSNFGQSWSSPILLFKASETAFQDMACSGNMAYFVWDGRFGLGVPWEIRCIRSTDGGLNWSSNILLSTPDGFPSELPSIYSDENGVVTASWMDFKYSSHGGTGDRHP